MARRPTKQQQLTLDRARMQWLFGDWDSLVDTSLDDLEAHSQRGEIALLVASARQHQGDTEKARELFRLSRRWGCDPQRIARVMSSDTHNGLARAAAISGEYESALHHFQEAVRGVGGDERLAFQARSLWELTRLGASMGDVLQRPGISELRRHLRAEADTSGEIASSQPALALLQGELALTPITREASPSGTSRRLRQRRNFVMPFAVSSGSKVADEAELRLVTELKEAPLIHCDEPFFFFSLPEQTHIYFASSEGADFSTPPAEAQISLEPECDYRIAATTALLGNASAQLWLIEYDGEKRLTHQQRTLSTGSLDIVWRTHSEHVQLSVAVRLQGQGTVMLTDVVLERIAEPQESSAPGVLPPGDNLSRDRVAQAYLGAWGGGWTQEKTKSRINWMAAQVSGNRVLDVGCSEGILAMLLAREGCEVVGLDVNEGALDYARSLLASENDFVQDRVRFIHGDLLTHEHGLEPSSFDTVSLGEVLEHLVRPQAMLEEGWKYLRSNGKLVVTTPYGYFPHEDHHQTFTIRELVRQLRDALFVPEHLSIVHDYIRFVGRKVETNAVEEWESYLHDGMLDTVEQAVIDQQKRLYAKIDTLTDKTQRLQKDTDEWDARVRLLQRAGAGLQQYITDTLIDRRAP